MILKRSKEYEKSNLKKIISVLVAGFTFVGSAVIPAYADDSVKSDDILYTNDVHCGIDAHIGYDGLALYKREMEAMYDNVFLVDAGDSISGTPVGTLSKGAYITRLMNAVGYDAAVVGNHEFDYSVSELMIRAEELNCGYVCTNFSSKETEELVFAPYKMVEAGDTKIAFVGAATPETLSASTPVYFQNDAGEYIYSFGEDGTIYTLLQNAVDDARAEGADHVVILGHLGESSATKGWSAPEIAAELTGVDVIIDGHSHETTPGMTVTDKDGREVIVTQTGTKLENIGKLTISPDGDIKTELVDKVPAPDDSMRLAKDSWTEPDGRDGIFCDEAVNLEIQKIYDELSGTLDLEIGKTDFDLTDSVPDTGARAVRNAETNLSDLCADAFREVLGADITAALPDGVVPLTWEPSSEHLVIGTEEARALYERIKAEDYPTTEELHLHHIFSRYLAKILLEIRQYSCVGLVQAADCKHGRLQSAACTKHRTKR